MLDENLQLSVIAGVEELGTLDGMSITNARRRVLEGIIP